MTKVNEPKANDVQVIEDEEGNGGEKNNNNVAEKSKKIVDDNKDKNTLAMESTVDNRNASGDQEKTQQVQPYHQTRNVARGNFKLPFL